MAGQTRMVRFSLYFGLLGGAAAWTLHLMLAHLIAEFGCIANVGETIVGPMSVVAWLISGASALALALGAAAMFAAHQAGRRAHEAPEGSRQDGDAYLARLGLMTSGVFVLIIAFQALPIFFYLRHC